MHDDLGHAVATLEQQADHLRNRQLVITTNGNTWKIEPADDQPPPDSKEAHPRKTRMSFVG